MKFNKNIPLAGYILFAFGFLLLILAASAPYFLSPSAILDIIRTVIPIIAFISLCIGCIVLWLYALLMILTAKNDTSWKFLWILGWLLFGFIAAIVYFAVANKYRLE